MSQDALARAHAQIAAVLGADDSDDDESGYIHKAKRPGAITPMGIRVDRGSGLLGMSSAATTLSEMDSAIISLKQWRQRNDQEMAAYKRRQEELFYGAYPSKQAADVIDELEEEARTSGRSETSGSDLGESELVPLRSSSPVDKPPHQACDPTVCPVSRAGSIASRSLTAEEMLLLKSTANMKFSRPSSARPQSAAPSLRSCFPTYPQTPWNNAESSLRPSSEPFSSEVASHSVRGTARPARPHSAIPGSKAGYTSPLLSSAADSPLSGSNGCVGHHSSHESPPSAKDTDTGSNQSSLSLARRSLLGGDGVGMRSGSGRARQLPPMSPNSFKVIGGAAEELAGSSGLAHSSLGPSSGGGGGGGNFRSSSSFTCNPSFGEADGAALPPRPGIANRGQELLDELEAELKELDDMTSVGAVGEVMQWHSDLESVLGKLDGLQTGYQVLSRAEEQRKLPLVKRPA